MKQLIINNWELFNKEKRIEIITFLEDKSCDINIINEPEKPKPITTITSPYINPQPISPTPTPYVPKPYHPFPRNPRPYRFYPPHYWIFGK